MQRLVVITLTIAVMPVAWRVVDACGDKFLLVGRGVRMQRAYAAVHPANILIYARPTTSANAAIRDPQFQKSLRQAGHSVSAIEDATLLDHALRSSSFDIVLADLTEAPTIDALVASAPSHPKPLYVEYPAAASRPDLKSQFICELKAGDRATKFLDRIDTEMKERAPKGAAHK